MTKTASFITLTNNGYIEYTLNCLESLKRISSPIQLKCFCIGKEGYEKLRGAGYNAVLINDEDNTNFQTIRTGNWSKIVQYKFRIIYEELKTHDYVLYTDGDIVYENPEFYEYLLRKVGIYDMLIQSEGLKDTSDEVLCSGFMFIKSNPTTLNLFNPIHTEKYRDIVGWGDQLYVNSIKEQLAYSFLPLNLYPNGRFYYQHSDTLNPYIIHFNWVKGHEKQERMQKYSKWFTALN
jgi:hypothetical protein